jgi:hypothetical protein
MSEPTIPEPLLRRLTQRPSVGPKAVAKMISKVSPEVIVPAAADPAVLIRGLPATRHSGRSDDGRGTIIAMVVATLIYWALASFAVIVAFALPDRRWLERGWSPCTDRVLVLASLVLWVAAPAVVYFWFWRLPRLFLSTPRSSAASTLALRHG